MATNNVINLKSTGVVSYDGAGAFAASTLTNHSVLVGAASNAITSLSVGATGTVLAGTTGADPSFTATPSVTSITLGGGTALGTYAESTWTPTITGSGSNPSTATFSQQTGTYTKIGRMVYVQCNLTISTLTGGTGNLQVSGLPFTVLNTAGFNPCGSGIILISGNTSRCVIRASTNTTIVSVITFQDGASPTLTLPNANLTTIQFSLTYFT